MKNWKINMATMFIAVAGCSTLDRSTLLGTGIGAVGGGAIGAASSRGLRDSNRRHNIAIGTGIGAFTGAIIGQQSHKHIDQRAKKLGKVGPTQLHALPSTTSMSRKPLRLKPARVKVRFVDDQVSGKTKIPAHFEYDIVEEAKWQ